MLGPERRIAREDEASTASSAPAKTSLTCAGPAPCAPTPGAKKAPLSEARSMPKRLTCVAHGGSHDDASGPEVLLVTPAVKVRQLGHDPPRNAGSILAAGVLNGGTFRGSM